MPYHHFEKEYNKEHFVQFADSYTVDAFSRLRTGSPHTEFDAKQLFDNLPLLYDDQETSGSGTSTSHSTATAQTTLSVSANTAGTRTRQSFRRFNYQPGKSQLIIMTGALESSVASGITARIGLFDDNNGIFFEADGNSIKAVIRSSTTGSPVDTGVAQSSWNIDRFDGTGPSGISLDTTKNQILFFDFEWLGAGDVRFGFFVNGRPYYVHKATWANSGGLGPYMSTPNLPLRYQLINDGNGPATNMRVGCQTVMSEGGNNHIDTGIVQTFSNGNTHIDATTGGTLYALIGMRLKTTHFGASVKPINVSVAPITNDIIEWQLLFNASVAGDPTYANETNSAVQTFYGATANTVTGGTVVAGGYVASTKDGGVGDSGLFSELLLGAAIDGTADTLVLAARPIGSGALNADVLGSITIRELA